MILGDGTEVRMGNTYGQGEVGDKRGSKEMDRCPLTLVCADYITNEKCKRNPEGRIVLANGQYTL
jgi:hypothetical protein